MAKKQATLFNLWSASAEESASVEHKDSSSSEQEDIVDDLDKELREKSAEMSCSHQCCADETKKYQPMDKPTLQSLRIKSRNFQSSWFKQFPWISVCVSRKTFIVGMPKIMD